MATIRNDSPLKQTFTLGAKRAAGSSNSNKKKKSSSKKADSNGLPTTAPKQIASYLPGTYASKYDKQIGSALNNVINFQYDPMKDASYQALAQVYGNRGNIAAQNTLADAAALNGGLQTSYAVSAAQQARNQYNQELAALIPDLEQNAFNRAQITYNALRDADETAYGRFRDTEADRQWKYGMDYDTYRDAMADYQFGLNYNYQAGRDKMSDKQWAKEFAYQKKRDKVADEQWNKEFAYNTGGYTGTGSSGGSSGGGGRRRSSGGGGGYSYSGGYSSGGGGQNNESMPDLRGAYDDLAGNKQKYGPTPSVPITIDAIAKNAVRKSTKKK